MTEPMPHNVPGWHSDPLAPHKYWNDIFIFSGQYVVFVSCTEILLWASMTGD